MNRILSLILTLVLMTLPTSCTMLPVTDPAPSQGLTEAVQDSDNLIPDAETAETPESISNTGTVTLETVTDSDNEQQNAAQPTGDDTSNEETASTVVTPDDINPDNAEGNVIDPDNETPPEAYIPSASELDYSSIPPFDGFPYAEVNGNIPVFTEEERISTTAFEFYSDLDSLGRCGYAFANVCMELMPTEERDYIGMIKPSGWHTVRYDDLIEGNYLYNRCHLIAFQLAGENANEKNLITGTRYLNTIGMLPFEILVGDYVKKTENHVLYRSTPVFIGEELVARGIHLEGYSVEDQGEGVCFNVFLYNNQPGIEIDYLTGESRRADEGELILIPAEITGTDSENETRETQETGVTSETQGSGPSYDTQGTGITSVDPSIATYVLNTNTMRFHHTNCSSVNEMKDKNKVYFGGTRDEAVSLGYTPCKICNP